MPKTLLTLILTAVVYTLSTAGASAASPDTWTATGLTATNSGEVMQYAVAGRAGTWTMQAKAGAARKVWVDWNYKGYHAWFGVKVAIERFVIRGGAQITETLQSASATRCCTAPSGGFNYQGTTRFEVQKDDVYGFRMTGSNADSDARLLGTLTLGTTDVTGLVNGGGLGGGSGSGGGGGAGMGGAIFNHG